MVSRSCLRRKDCQWLTPHPSSKLSETADETCHTDDGVRDGDTLSLEVVQREYKHGGSVGEETTGDVI